MTGKYCIMGENKDKIINLKEYRLIKSIEKNVSKESLYKAENIITGLDFDFDTSYLLLLEENDSKDMLEVLTEKEAITWVLENNQNEVFEEEFKPTIELSDFKLLRPIGELEEDLI